MENDDLIEELKNQNLKALHEFIDKYGRLIYGVINSGLVQPHEKAVIDECFDDILLDIWYNIESYDASKGKFVNWLISVCKFNVIDYKRKLSNSYNTYDIDSVVLQDKTNVEDDIISNEEKDRIKDYINKLEQPDREIFVRRYINEESIDEISTALHISKDNIYNRLSRGRKRLKNIMMEGYYEK